MSAAAAGPGVPAEERGLHRRAFLARTAALGTLASAGGTALAGAALAGPAAAAPGAAAPAAVSGVPRFAPAAWVRPRPEAVADITELTVAEAAWLVRAGRLRPVELVDAYLERIEAYDGVLLAFNLVRARAARAEARRVTRQRTPLSGIPLAVKDNYFTEGVETTANSTIFEGFVPPYDATTVARLKAAGGIVLGKTQMGPLATTRATLPDGTVTTVNAWAPQDPEVDPGGSSSGSGTATAARLVTSSIGTQTGGSITSPANAQNLTGLKPTMGRASLRGIVPLTFTRDHPGPLARDAMDAAIMLTAMAGPDPADPRTQGLPPVPDLVTAAAPARSGGRPAVRWATRVGVPPDYLSGPEAPSRRRFLRELDAVRGITVVPVELPAEWELLTDTFNAVRLPERTEPFLPFLREDLRLFGVSLTSWVQGLFLSGDEWITGQRAKLVLLERILEGMLGAADVVVQDSPVPFDIVGLPELALPVGIDSSSGVDLPVGTILGAGPYEEDRLLAVAAAYQQVTDHHLRRPADPAPSRRPAPESSAAARASVPAGRRRLSAEEVAARTQ